MAKSKIEWTDATWNSCTGCTEVSPGCDHCYAHRMSLRCQAMGLKKYANAFKLTLHPDTLELPLSWKRPSTIFVNSMSDLFHADVPLVFIQRVFDVTRRAHWHRFQNADQTIRPPSSIGSPVGLVTKCVDGGQR